MMDEDGHPLLLTCAGGACDGDDCSDAGSHASSSAGVNGSASVCGTSHMGSDAKGGRVNTGSGTNNVVRHPWGKGGGSARGEAGDLEGGFSSTEEAARGEEAGDDDNDDNSFGDRMYVDDSSGDDDAYGLDGKQNIHESGAGGMNHDAGTEATLCRVPTVACLRRACGKSGTEMVILWEGFGCFAADFNITFICRVGGVEVEAVAHGFSTGTDDDSRAEGDWGWGEGKKKAGTKEWGPAWGTPGKDRNDKSGAAGGALVFNMPRLDWVEEGDAQAVMVPVEVLWTMPEQVGDTSWDIGFWTLFLNLQ